MSDEINISNETKIKKNAAIGTIIFLFVCFICWGLLLLLSPPSEKNNPQKEDTPHVAEAEYERYNIRATNTPKPRPTINAPFIRAYVIGDKAKVYANPNIEAYLITQIPINEAIYVIGDKQVNNDLWLQIALDNDHTGWLLAKNVHIPYGAKPSSTPTPTKIIFITATNTRKPLPTPTSTTKQTASNHLIVTSNLANIRSGPGTPYDVIDILKQGDIVSVIGRTQDNSWFNIKLDNGNYAWIGSSIVEPIKDFDIDSISIVATIPAPPTVTSSPPTSTSPLPTELPPLIPPSNVCSCSGNIYNCKDFSTHNQAQSCFNYCVAQGVGDIHNLDRDNDGLACESLP